MQTKNAGHQQSIVAIAKGGGIAFIGRLGALVLYYLLAIVLARGLGAEQYGLYVVGFALTSLVGSIALLGLNRGTVRFIALYRGEEDEQKELGAFLTAVRIAFINGLIASVLIAFLAKPLAALLNIPGKHINMLWLFAGWIGVWVCLYELTAVVEAIKQLKYRIILFDIGWPLARLLMVLVVFFLGGQLHAVILANVAATLMIVVLLGVVVYKLFYRQLKGVVAVLPIRQLITFSIPVMFFNIVMLSQSQIEVYLLTILQSAEVSGIFSVAARTAVLIVAFLEGLSIIFSPFVADLANRHQFSELNDLMSTVTRWSLMIGLPATVLVILLREQLLLFFGPEFLIAAPALTILAIGQLINAITGPVGILLTMAGWSNLNLLNSLLMLIISILFGILFIPKYGILGAAISSSISTSLVNIVRLFMAYKLLHVWAYNRFFLKPVISTIIALVIPLTLSILYNMSSHWWYIINAIVFFITYISIVYIFRLDESDLMIVHILKSRLFGPLEKADKKAT